VQYITFSKKKEGGITTWQYIANEIITIYVRTKNFYPTGLSIFFKSTSSYRWYILLKFEQFS
jgi:hypothetical protein